MEKEIIHMKDRFCHMQCDSLLNLINVLGNLVLQTKIWAERELRGYLSAKKTDIRLVFNELFQYFKRTRGANGRFI